MFERRRHPSSVEQIRAVTAGCTGIAVCCLLAATASPSPAPGGDDGLHAGPRTQPVALTDYHEIRHISSQRGSDTKGRGSATQPWRSIRYALARMSDSGPGKRYALLAGAGGYGGEPIHMRRYVDLYGGFDARDWSRDIFVHCSVLTGAGERRVLVGADHARIDGFIIKKGVVRGKGAGMLCDGVSPTITNNVFVSNKTLAPDRWQPVHLHEIANDGGALYCGDAASPTVRHNLFANNSTEIGRGAAIACHNKASPIIADNVILDNVAGMKDPKRSSDGGAISVFQWCRPVIENNLILANRALASNDGGGMFVALWSSPVISGNTFVGNQCDDDGGALFIGGQEHRYDRPPDPLPPKEQFFIRINGNTIVGNFNGYRNSGAMRFTQESRGLFSNNIVAHNSGIDFERSEATIVNNTILDRFLFTETKEGLRPGIITNNILWGPFDLKTDAVVSYCNIRGRCQGEGNIHVDPKFAKDSIQFVADSTTYDRGGFTTVIFVSGQKFRPNGLTNRIVKAGTKWGVIGASGPSTLTVWGDLAGEVSFTVLPTYQLAAASPCIGAGTATNAPARDRYGNRRSQDQAIDIGAAQYTALQQ